MNRPIEINRKSFIFDLVFAKEVKHICICEPPAGSSALDFSVLEFPEYGIMSYDPDKERQALEVLFIATGKAWCAAKENEIKEDRLDG